MKRKVILKNIFIGFNLAFIILFLTWIGCRKVPIVYTTSDVVNITGYLDEHPDTFSEFREILKITGDEGFLGAYGTYTLFLPTNDAINAYLQKIGKSSVNDVNIDTLKALVRFHLLMDTLYTTSFTDGKLPVLNMYGQYLTTLAVNENGITHIQVNRQAYIIQSNIRVGNGVIHVIDHVLEPAKYTLAQLIENNPRYSIFAQALRATGYYDTLNIQPNKNPDTTEAWLTVIAESDSVLQAAGFNSFEDLKARYDNLGNPMDPNDSLHVFVAYHILYGALYLADIVSSSSHHTLVPDEVVTSKLVGQTVLINDDVFNGVHEPGVILDRSYGDISATNGVLQDAEGHFTVKVRTPFPVYWDVCRFPEIMNLPQYYQKQNYSFTLSNMPSFINDPGPSGVNYKVGGTFVYGDYLEIPLGGPGRSPWIEFKTPLIVKGKYKVWICYRTAKGCGSCTNVNQISIDGVPLQRTMNFTVYMPTGTDAEMEAQGWKYYTYPPSRNWASQLVGTIDIKTTDTHVIRFTTLQGTQNTNWLDMIEFIPVDMDQIYPRFDQAGNPHYQ